MKSHTHLLGVALGLAVMLTLSGTATAQIVVDDFVDAQGPVEDPGTDASTADQAAGTILGGERDLAITRTQGVGIASAEVLTVGPDSILRIVAPPTAGAPNPDTGSQLVVSWDGNDNDATVLDPTGLGGVDLTAGNAGGFTVTVESAGAPFALTLTIHQNGTHSSRASRLVSAVATSTDVVIDFSELQPVGSGGGADLTDIGAVELTATVAGTTVDISSVALTAPAVTVSKQALATDGGALPGTLTPGSTFKYRVDVGGDGGETSAAQILDDISNDLTLSPATVLTTPVARPDQYEAFGNVPKNVAAPGLLANDSDPDNGGVLGTLAVMAQATAAGGTVDIALDGSFVYTPPAGLRGVDQFSYTVIDDEGQQATGIATVAIKGQAWFVDSDACPVGALPCGSGTFGDPFGALEQAAAASLPGDVIRLRQGSEDLTHHDQGIVLQPGQQLIGQGVDLVLDGVVIEGVDSDPDLDPTPANRPTLTHTAGAGITLADGATVLGLNIAGSSGAGVLGATVDGVTIDHVAVVDSGGAALKVSTSTNLDLTFTGLDSLTSTEDGVLLDTVTGSLTVTGTTQLDDPAGAGLRMINSPGFVASFGAVNVVDAGGGLPHPALELTSDAGATFTFGTLNLDSENGPGLLADNGGTVNLASIGNVVNAVGGAAVDIQSTIGNAGGNPGWSFDSLVSTGSPTTGIRLVSISDDFNVGMGGTTITDPDTTGILVQNSGAGTGYSFGATSVVDTSVGAGATANGIDLATGNSMATFTFSSLNVVTDGGFGLRVNDSGTVTIGGAMGNSLVATGGAALDATSTGIGGSGWIFDALSSIGSPTFGVNLVSMSGTITASGGSITGAAGTAFNVAMGAPVVTYGGSLTQNAAQRVVNIQDTVGGTVVFTTGTVSGGAASLGVLINNADGNASFADLNLGTSGSPMTNQALTLSGGSAGTFTFADTQVFTTGARGVSASNGGVVQFTGAGNRVSTTGARAVTLEGGTTIGPLGATFLRIDASNADRGVVVNGTGPAGGFSITGNGSTPGSGGLIQNTAEGVEAVSMAGLSLAYLDLTNANNVDGGGAGVCDGNTNTGCLAAVQLVTVNGADLTGVRITGAEEMGVNGRDVTDLDLVGSQILNAGNAINEHGLHIRGLFGTLAAGTDSSIVNTIISNSNNHNVFIVDSTATSANPSQPDLLTVTGSTISNLSAPNGANGLLHEARDTANMRLVVSGSTFRDNRGIGINLQAAQGGRNQLSVTSCTFGSTSTTAGSPDPFQDAGISIGATQTSHVDFDVSNNGQFTSRNSHHVNVVAFDTASITGTVANNANMNGSINGSGVRAAFEGGSTGVLSISGNTIGGLEFGRGIDLQSRAGAGSLDVTVSNNDISSTISSGTFANDGVFVAAGNGDSGESSQVCVHFANNTSAGGSGRDGYHVEQYTGTTFQIQNLTPASGATATQVEDHIVSENVSGTASVTPAGFGNVVAYTAGTCATP